MYLGLDIGRQYVKMVAVEKTKEGYKVLDAGSRLVPDANSAYDPEKIDRSPTSVVTVCLLMGIVSKTSNHYNPRSYVSALSQRKVPLTLPPLILVSKILVRCFSCAT